MDDAIALDLKSTNNREALKATLHASCYCCIKTFNSSDIVDWADYGRTAVCPLCGVDAIVPGIIAIEVLQRLNQHWFHCVRD